MIVVSDTSPIRALAFLEQLTVLERLFGTVVIPPAVVDELANPARLAPGESPVELSRFAFIEVRIPAGQTRVEELADELDRGESEAIVLAEELHCPAIVGHRAQLLEVGDYLLRAVDGYGFVRRLGQQLLLTGAASPVLDLSRWPSRGRNLSG